MPLPKERIHYLLEAYISKQASDEEENELMDWILEAGENSELKNYILSIWNEYRPTDNLSYVDWNEIYSRAIQPPVALEPKVRKIKWFRLIAAAVLITLTAGSYFYFAPHTQEAIGAIQLMQADIAPPAGNKAVLRLSDGSKVWINVGSSLTYPIAFAGNERKVIITGEAYFEVAHDAGLPFVVQHEDVTVRFCECIPGIENIGGHWWFKVEGNNIIVMPAI